MDMEKIIEAILNYVEPDCEITGSSSLKNDCGLTSFDMICLVDELSTAYDTEIEKTDLKACVTVNDLAALFGAAEEATV